MTLEDQIQLCDQFIKAEPDTTIRDFLAAIREIDAIKCEAVNKVEPPKRESVVVVMNSKDGIKTPLGIAK